jgi:hypothetical protein
METSRLNETDETPQGWDMTSGWTFMKIMRIKSRFK